jgi:hypothetical protein
MNGKKDQSVPQMVKIAVTCTSASLGTLPE